VGIVDNRVHGLLMGSAFASILDALTATLGDSLLVISLGIPP
jgi:hypothetical protein